MTTAKPNTGGRPPGSRNVKPSLAELDRYRVMLREAADDGDAVAAGLLVMNHTLERHVRQERTAWLKREARDERGSHREQMGRWFDLLQDLVQNMPDEPEQRDAGTAGGKG